MSVKISEHDEQRLRSLAGGLAQGIRDPSQVLKELGFTEDDWRELEKSRTFRKMLESAVAEWNDAASTAKRVKLKAGINIEMSLPQFYQDMNDASQPLGARVRVLEAMTALAGLPQQEAVERAPGAQFKLEIHLGGPDDKVISVGVGGAIPASSGATLERHETFKLPDYLIDYEGQDTE